LLSSLFRDLDHDSLHINRFLYLNIFITSICPKVNRPMQKAPPLCRLTREISRPLDKRLKGMGCADYAPA
jgi:hypothetical protein